MALAWWRPNQAHLRKDDGRTPVHQGVIDLFLVKTFAGSRYWGFIDPQIVIDYENQTDFMLLEIQAGMMVGQGGHSLYAMPSIGIGVDRPYDFSLEAGWKVVW